MMTDDDGWMMDDDDDRDQGPEPSHPAERRDHDLQMDSPKLV